MNENLKDHDILLVREKGSNELKVANTDRDGKLKQSKPDGENPDFLRIDRNENMAAQCKTSKKYSLIFFTDISK